MVIPDASAFNQGGSQFKACKLICIKIYFETFKQSGKLRLGKLWIIHSFIDKIDKTNAIDIDLVLFYFALTQIYIPMKF